MVLRNYGKEYKNFQKKEEEKKKRASRNAARRMLMKNWWVKKGDGKDVAHKNGNPKDNNPKNLAVVRKSKNRSYARTKTAGKLHRTA